MDEVKSQGNAVAFRNLKEATDEAITLFSNKEAIEEIIVQPHEDYIEKFDEAVERVMGIAPTFDSVNDLVSEDEELEFVKAFRELMRMKNVLNTFTEFSFEDLGMDEQTFLLQSFSYNYDIVASPRSRMGQHLAGDGSTDVR